MSHRVEAGVVPKIGNDAQGLFRCGDLVFIGMRICASAGRLHQAIDVAARVENQTTTSIGKFDCDGLADAACSTSYDSDKGFVDAGHGSIRGFVRRWFVVELLPFDSLIHRFDA